MSKWEPNHGPPLTMLEQEMRDLLSNMAVWMKHFRFKDQHNRTIQLSSADVELEHSYSRSSYISMCIDGRLTIGHIEAFFLSYIPIHTNYICHCYLCWKVHSEQAYLCIHKHSITVCSCREAVVQTIGYSFGR